MKSTLCAAALAAVAALMLAGCVTSNTIEGHQIRGIASVETPVEKAAREFWEDVGRDVADAYGDDPQVQAAIRARQAERLAMDDPRDLHRNAPAWFHDYWRAYLAHAAGGYATIAVDRNGRGASYVYCLGSAGCINNNAAWARSFTDVRYKHRALRQCNEHVRREFPTAKPDCAIYAINNKIVWKGSLPWK